MKKEKILKLTSVMGTFLVGILLISCGTAENADEPVSVNQETSLPLLAEANLDLDGEVILGRDHPIYMRETYVTPTQDGYYYMYEDYLKFLDKKTGEKVFVCTQVTCGHDDMECDAYFDARYVAGMSNGIWYYGDKLYYIGTGETRSDYALWSMNLDGTGREKVTDLFKAEGENDFIYSLSIHRGYMYYALSNTDFLEPACLYQVELKQNAKPKVLYTANETTTTIYRLKAYGDGIFFQEGYYPGGELDAGDNYMATVCYVTADGDCYQVLAGPQKFYNIIDNKLYYTTNEGEIRCYDWETNDDTLFVEAKGISNISFDSEYIYFDNYMGTVLDDTLSKDDRIISCYDRQGSLVHSMNIPRGDSEACIFGDEKYLWMTFNTITEEGEFTEMLLKIYDKSQIQTGGTEWTTLEVIKNE